MGEELLSIASGPALGNPVVSLPCGTDAGGALDGTWNAYQRDATGREWDAARANAAASNFQPTFGTNFLPQGQAYGPLKAGNMVAITSAAENLGMRQITNGTHWVGLTDSTGTSTIDGYNYAPLGAFETGGGGAGIAAAGGDPGFRWVTGESTAYKDWGGGEPKDYAGVEDAAEFLDNGLWNDNDAGSTLPDSGNLRLTPSIIEYRVNVPASIITTIDAWRTTFYKSGSTLIDSPARADAHIGGFDQASSATAYYTHMNMTSNGGEGSFGGDLGVFGTNGGDTEDYAILSTGMLVITEANTYQFATTSDDGARMRLDTNRDGVFDFELNDDVLQGQGAADFSSVISLGPGL